MFKWSAFPFIRVSLTLALGILAYDFYPELWNHKEILLAIGAICLVFFWFFRKHRIAYGALILLFITYSGGSLASLNDEPLLPIHYSNYPHIDGFVGTVVSDNTERTNYQRYDLQLHYGRKDSVGIPLTGKIFLYVKKAENERLLEYGDVVAVSRSYFAIPSPKNPHEFDYRNYLKRQNIFAHAFIGKEDIRKIDYSPPNKVLSFAYKVRGEAHKQLNEYISYERERAILTALLLGIKDHLDNDIKSAYAAAGAMHVLAVSGLHVGIIYYVLLLLFSRLKAKRWGTVPFVLFSVTVIWLYALVTGFSPSVMRAATMFSVIIISDGFRRKANIYNSLGVAACILIVYDPNMIYSVGFQLSFAAVFGIVKLYPRLYRSVDFNNKIADYLWSITCVSIAAQIATFPLTLLYFHQLPTYFLISNLLVIPAATVMLGVGIIMLLVGSIFPVVGKAIGFYFQEAVWFMNEIVAAIQALPHPVYDWLYLDAVDVALIYLFLIFLVIGLSRFSYPNLVLAAIAMIVLFGWLNIKEFNQYKNEKIIFYGVEDATAIDLIDGQNAVLLIDSFSLNKQEVIDYQINPNRLANGLFPADETISLMKGSDLVFHHPAYDLIAWKGKRILLIEDLNGYTFKEPVYADIVYLKKPQYLDMNGIRAQQLILGTEFNYYDIKRAIAAYGNEIEVHSLSQDGFWELDLSKTIW